MMCKQFVLVAFLSCVTAVQLKPDDTNRIINGDIASDHQFPYAISLQQLGYPQLLPTRGHRCGGVLFTLQHALTAASCLYNENNGNFMIINPNEYRVFAGATSLTNDTSPNFVRNIANFTVHPEYLRPPAHVNDIAIITLITPFNITFVQPLPLPASNFEPATFTRCTVTGWGAADVIDTASVALRYANKYIYGQDICTAMYNPTPVSLNILPSMVCAASKNTVAAGCTNDEGNALVCNNTLTGVLFMTDGCRSWSYPEVYTRVSNYTTWIRTVSSAPTIFSPGAILLLTTAVSALLFH